MIRGDLELWGVDKVRMKRRFQEHGVEIAPTGQTIFIQVPAPLPTETAANAKPMRAAG